MMRSAFLHLTLFFCFFAQSPESSISLVAWFDEATVIIGGVSEEKVVGAIVLHVVEQASFFLALAQLNVERLKIIVHGFFANDLGWTQQVVPIALHILKSIKDKQLVLIFLNCDFEADIIFIYKFFSDGFLHIIAVVNMHAVAFKLQSLHQLDLFVQ